MTQDNVTAVGATRIAVGTSAIIAVGPIPGCVNTTIKIFSGGGTLEIVPFPVALTGSSAAGWGVGYPVGANELISIGGPARFYLAATGATMVAAVLPSYAGGVSLSV